jgi:hypothetical protein
MPSARAIVAAAKNYRVAHADATANMIEDALRDHFLGGESAPAEWASAGADDAELPFSGALGFVVGRVYEALFPLDRDTIYSHIKAAVQIALETDLAAHETAGARRNVRLGSRFAVLHFALAILFAFALKVEWLALPFALFGLIDVYAIGAGVRKLRALRNNRKPPSVGANQHRAMPR